MTRGALKLRIPGWWIALIITTTTIAIGMIGVVAWAIVRVVERYT